MLFEGEFLDYYGDLVGNRIWELADTEEELSIPGEVELSFTVRFFER